MDWTTCLTDSHDCCFVEVEEKDWLKASKMPIKVEPKVYFANERTFLSWLHTSVILLSLLLHLPIRIHRVRCMGSCYVQFRLRSYYTLFGNVRFCNVLNFFTTGLLCLMNPKTKLLPTHSRHLDPTSWTWTLWRPLGSHCTEFDANDGNFGQLSFENLFYEWIKMV